MSTKRTFKATYPATITVDQWAESGGTVGMYARGVRSGKIKIVENEDEDFGDELS